MTPARGGGVRPTRLTPGDVLRLGVLGLRVRPLRAALSALGISIGIATMLAVIGIPASSQAALMRELSALGTNVLQVTVPPNEDPPVLLPKESVGMAQRIGPVTVASAVANTHLVARRSDRTDPRDGLGLSVLASRIDLLPAVNAGMAQGNWFTSATAHFPTVVLGSVAATRLGFTEMPLDGRGHQVMIGDQWFTVIGILATTPLSPEIDRAVLVGWEAAEKVLRFDGHPTVIYLQVHEPAIEAVRAVLPATVYPERPGDVLVTRPSEALAAKRATANSFSALFLGLAATALLVGGIGVANTMVISVLERRSEIGLRRALGANRGQIRVQFLTESVVLAGLGGVLGTVLGLAATAAWAVWHGWPVVVPVAATATGLGGAGLVGMLAGLYPSMRAARLTPVEALATV
ncbi:ABC transporter permease [Actinoplanes sp. NPDC023936]|uniref:ABC transporter permease n=1 Tax=Actinoplanes sp. NPDC023936 TaxID=3154910 RepID=UPI00340F2694